MQHRGRLAVFSPDGPIQNFFIEKTTIAIGRSSGNDLMLDRHGISRYHASITLGEGNRTAELRDLDSVNGTYVDGIRLQADDTRILRGGEEIQLGDLRLIFHPAADDTSDQTVQVRVQSADAVHFAVELEGPNIAVTPGAHGPATVSITNKTSDTIRVVLRIEGVPPTWVRLDQAEFDLQGGQQREIGINFKPLRRFDTKPGMYDVTLHVGTVDTNYPPIEIHTRVQILQFNGYGAVLGTPHIQNGESFKLYVHNQGNGPLPLRFLGRDRDNALDYDISPSQVVLDAGQRITVNGQISAKKQPVIGQSELITYDIITQSLSASAFVAPVSGQVEIVPRVARWRLPLGVALGVGAIIILFAALLVLTSGGNNGNDTEAPQPQISRFVVNGSAANTTIEVNEPILVQWQADDAQVIYLNAENDAGDGVAYTLASEAPDGHVLYLPAVGDYQISILATNDDNAVTSPTVIVRVVPQLRISTHTVSQATTEIAPVLYRNVGGQQITIEWHTDWGKGVPLPNDLQVFVDNTQQFQVTTAHGQQTIDANGFEDRADGVLIELRDSGNILQSIWLPTLYAECATQRDITLYDWESNTSPMMSIAANMTLRADARNNMGWVRVILPVAQSELGYWGWVSPDAVADLDCPINLAELTIAANE